LNHIARVSRDSVGICDLRLQSHFSER
jgi:hypothetical protein